MNREDIIRMAQECNLIGMRPHLDGIYQESLERFADLVAAHEREECAKVLDEMAEDMVREMEPSPAIAWVRRKAAAIRGRK